MYQLATPRLRESVSYHLFDTRPVTWTLEHETHPGLLGKTRYEVRVPVLNAEGHWVGTFWHEPLGQRGALWYLSAYPSGELCWKGSTLDAGYRALQANPALLPMRDVPEIPAPFPYYGEIFQA